MAVAEALSPAAPPDDIRTHLQARSSRVDAEVQAAYTQFLSGLFGDELAVLAVGGYGRREQFPYSDVDLLLLVQLPDFDASRKEAVASFLRALWDTGMRVSHSVHTVADCCRVHEENIELAISLLDQRWLAGSQTLHSELTSSWQRFLQKQHASLTARLARMTQLRQQRFQASIYHLEPNIKEGPGGLRDAQTLAWLHALGGAPVPPAIQEEAWPWLARVRFFLHQRAGRDQNQLTFERQDELAATLSGTTPESLMRLYYQQARFVLQSVTYLLDAHEDRRHSLADTFRDWRTRLSTTDFSVMREHVYLRSPAQWSASPELVFGLFAFVARHGVRLALDTERRVQERASQAGLVMRWPQLEAMLDAPHAALALRAMHNTGLLSAVLPEWGGIDCLVVRDYHHRYTVDEHTLVALSLLDELPATGEPARRSFANLLSELGQPALLRLALLFHDIGKGGEQDEDHAVRSVRLARRAMQNLAMPAADQEFVVFLVAEHLLLSSAMTHRDLNDPAVARQLAGKIGTLERLKALTLLTYADSSAVHPTAMTTWRLQQLWRAYTAVHRELTSELDTDRIRQASTEADFLEGLPTRYLHTRDAEAIAAHQTLVHQARAAGVAVSVEKDADAYNVVVIARDKPALFAALAGALSGFGLNILHAEAFRNTEGLVLDSFTADDPHRSLDLNPTERDRLMQTLRQVAKGELSAQQVLRRRKRPSLHAPEIEPSVAFDHESSPTATLIQIVAQDRPGLLHDVALCLSEAGCNIEVVLVDTQAHRALDVFYVTRDGSPLGPLNDDLREALLAACRDA